MKHSTKTTLVSCSGLLALLALTGAGCVSKESGTTKISTEVPAVVEKAIDNAANKLIEEMKEAIPTTDELKKELDDSTKEAMERFVYDYDGTLEDVSGGDAFGTVSAAYIDGTYSVRALMYNLPETEEGFFYEGWVVRKKPLDIVSTGPVDIDINSKVYVNKYQSGKDLTDHNFYVLTLEPDDGDPAPSEHILEGTLEQ